MLDSTVVCRRALGCEWGGGNPEPTEEKNRLRNEPVSRRVTELAWSLCAQLRTRHDSPESALLLLPCQVRVRVSKGWGEGEGESEG